MKTQQFIRSGIIVAALYGAAAVIGYLTRVFLSRYVSLADFGLFYSVLTFVLAFSLICDLGFSQVIQVYVPKLRKKLAYSKIKGYLLIMFGWQLITRIIVITFLIANASFIAQSYFQETNAVWLIYILAFAFLLSSFGSFTAGLIGFHYFGSASFINLFRVTTYLIFMYVTFWYTQNVFMAAGSYLLSMIATDILTLILFFKKAMPNFFKIKTIITKEMFKDMFKFGFMLTLSSLALQAIGVVDTLSITYFRSLEELGLYQMALPTAAIVVFMFAWPISLMLPATIAQLKTKQQRHMIEEVSKLLFLIIVPLIAFFTVFAEEILQILFNHTSELGTLMLRLLAIHQATFIFVLFYIGVLTGLKRPKDLLRISVIMTSIILVLSVIGSWQYGALGAIAGYLVAFVIFITLARHSIKISCGIRSDWKYISKVVLIGFICLGLIKVVSLLNINNLIKMILAAVAGFAVYFGIALFTGVLSIKLLEHVFKIKLSSISLSSFLRKIGFSKAK